MRAEERCGDAGHGASRDESLGVHAKAVGGAGDDHTFAGGEGAEAGAGNFFGGLLAALGAVGLASNVVELGGGRTRTEDADTDAQATDFFGEAFAEKQVECFGGSVGGDEGHGLKCGGGGDDEDIAVAALDHAREVEAREVDDGDDVYLHHFELAGQVGAVKVAVGTEAGVVDKQVEVYSLPRGEGEDFVGSGGAGEVGGAELDADVVQRLDVRGKLLESVAAACGEDKVSAASGELEGESSSDASAGAGDERPFVTPVRHSSSNSKTQKKTNTKITEYTEVTERTGVLGCARDGAGGASMKRGWRRVAGVVIAALLLAGCAGVAEAQQPPPGPQPAQAPPAQRPNPLATRQHFRMAFLAGQWEEQITYANAKPGEESFTGRWRARPSLGLYLQIDYEGTGPQGLYRAFGVLTWDREAQVYRLWWFDDAAGVGEYEGDFTDENTLTLEHSGTVEGRAFRERIRYTRVSANEVRTQVDQAWGTGAYQPYLEATARRMRAPGGPDKQPPRN